MIRIVLTLTFRNPAVALLPPPLFRYTSVRTFSSGSDNEARRPQPFDFSEGAALVGCFQQIVQTPECWRRRVTKTHASGAERFRC
jgi:hypothetical protein